MGVYKKRNTWYISYQIEKNRRKREAVGPSKALAKLVLNKRIADVTEKKFLNIAKIDKIKFRDFADEYLKIHSARNKGYYTELKNIGILKKYLDDKYLHEITILDIERFKTERAKKVAPATVNRSLAILKSMLNRADEWGKLKDNLAHKIKLLKVNNERVRFLEQDKVQALLSNCAPHLKPIVIVALNTGMRKSEILGLKWADVDFKRATAHLSDTKSGKGRDIPLNSTVLSTLTAITKVNSSEFIFCNKDGKPYGDIKKSFLTAINKSGIINFTFHDLRHDFSSKLAMAGVDLNKIRVLLGHSSTQMTLRYAHLSPDCMREAVDILDRQKVTVMAPSSSNVPDDILTAS